MNDNKTIQPKDDKTETDYQPEVSKIAKRGKNQNLFYFSDYCTACRGVFGLFLFE